MITARHQWWAEWVFFRYVRGLVQRHFNALRLLGELPEIDPSRPLLLVPNHGTWWDGFFVYLLNRLLFRRQLFLMMLDEQLARYRFFSRVGAFGIRPGLPRSVAETLRYSAALLREPGNALCLFPQGELRYHALRPLGYERGLERILKLSGTTVQLLPLGIRCELLGEQRPDAFFLADRCHVLDSASFPGMQWLEEEEQRLLERMEQAVRSGDAGRLLLRGKLPLDERWGG
ncbi:MAG: lysophospholipid acyltransferase family protein [Spirochaetales bacterium]|nr:lysophospholipid acyltransferase family protein [Spirochaetales bacterium]